MLFALPLFAFLQADPSAALLKWIDNAGQAMLSRRESVIAAVHTPEQARNRQREVREKILELVGGLPDYNGPLNARVTGTIDAGRYTIDKVVFESLPKYFVTANLYVPKSGGLHPGVLFPLGHWDQGKPAAQQIAGNLAIKGFVVLAYDPMGQGERLQAFDSRLGASLAGGSVPQHLQAGAQSYLVGESYARYHIWDAKRALDYLVSRPEVDAVRIGCTGCSGGGTITTYISALDDRIKVAAPACYMNSWRKLLAGPTGDAEQTLAGFLSSGLDMSDYVELFAPKPWLMASTEGDFFTPAGAKIVYDEARLWYGIFGATDRVKWVVGPGGHGTPLPVREAIYDWMIRWLNSGQGSSKEQDVTMRPDFEFQVTKSGQVSTEFDSAETFQFIRERYRSQVHPAAPAELRAWVKQLVSHRELRPAQASGDSVTLDVDEGLSITARLFGTPTAKAPATILVGRGRELEEVAARLKASGETVLMLDPRGTPFPAPRDLTGDWISNARAMVIGRNLPALRAHDILCAVDALAQLNAGRISVVAWDVAGVWSLLAAAADERIAHLELIRTPYSLRSALDSPVARGLYEAVVPGLVLKGDLADLAAAIGRDRVTWRDPVNWMRNPVQIPGAVYTTFGH